MITVDELIAFEKDIESIYKSGTIRGPIHLRNGNEQQLINIFKNIHSQDFVFATWANHLICLCHGVPKERLKAEILAGRSMSLSFAENCLYTSAIVGGICSIATGAAYGIKLRQQHQRVWAFIGDMTLMCGIAQESIRYSFNHKLPITWIIEDNGKSVDTPTTLVWNRDCESEVNQIVKNQYSQDNSTNIIYYKYNLTYPHSGIGKFISF
jgi:pyruvate dehydrogenase E1 component alpha subunit